MASGKLVFDLCVAGTYASLAVVVVWQMWLQPPDAGSRPKQWIHSGTLVFSLMRTFVNFANPNGPVSVHWRLFVTVSRISHGIGACLVVYVSYLLTRTNYLAVNLRGQFPSSLAAVHWASACVFLACQAATICWVTLTNKASADSLSAFGLCAVALGMGTYFLINVRRLIRHLNQHVADTDRVTQLSRHDKRHNTSSVPHSAPSHWSRPSGVPDYKLDRAPSVPAPKVRDKSRDLSSFTVGTSPSALVVVHLGSTPDSVETHRNRCIGSEATADTPIHTVSHSKTSSKDEKSFPINPKRNAFVPPLSLRHVSNASVGTVRVTDPSTSRFKSRLYSSTDSVFGKAVRRLRCLQKIVVLVCGLIVIASLTYAVPLSQSSQNYSELRDDEFKRLRPADVFVVAASVAFTAGLVYYAWVDPCKRKKRRETDATSFGR